MEDRTITAVGIDVSKGKSTVAVRRPGGEVVLTFFILGLDTYLQVCDVGRALQ
jgi:hypothetical protein